MKISAIATFVFGAVGLHAYTFHSEKKTFAEARAFCQAAGGDLASVHSQSANDYLVKVIGDAGEKNAWIGLTDDGTEGSWGWTDGSVYDFHSWAKNQPDDHTVENCAVVFKQPRNPPVNVWNDQKCGDKRAFFCSDAGTHSNGWIFVNSYSGTYDGCNAKCNALYGTDLYSIHDSASNTGVFNEWNTARGQGKATTYAWVGLRVNSANQWVWEDGVVIGTGTTSFRSNGQFSYWQSGEPNSSGEACMHMGRYGGGRWNDAGCGTISNCFCTAPWATAAESVAAKTSASFVITPAMIVAVALSVLALSVFAARLLSSRKTTSIIAEKDNTYGATVPV